MTVPNNTFQCALMEFTANTTLAEVNSLIMKDCTIKQEVFGSTNINILHYDTLKLPFGELQHGFIDSNNFNI